MRSWKKLFWDGAMWLRQVFPRGRYFYSIMRKTYLLPSFKVGGIRFPSMRWYIPDFFGVIYLHRKGFRMRYISQERALGLELVAGKFF